MPTSDIGRRRSGVTAITADTSAFAGFANPAVVTVAAVLVLSRTLQNSGVVDLIGEQLLRFKGGVMVQLAALTSMNTLIGTPPTIIASTFRAQTGAPPFGMFDFTPVGAGVAVAGLVFIILVVAIPLILLVWPLGR